MLQRHGVHHCRLRSCRGLALGRWCHGAILWQRLNLPYTILPRFYTKILQRGDVCFISKAPFCPQACEVIEFTWGYRI
eukprot:5843474-Pleurochrysis_carterae.AAC.1